MQLCKFFMEQGTCPHGQSCQFSHGYQELRQPTTAMRPVVAPLVQPPIRRATAPQPTGRTSAKQTESYKTAVCSNYANTGHCQYGNKCMFAHSPLELRTATTGEKVGKSVLCKTWMEKGSILLAFLLGQLQKNLLGKPKPKGFFY